MKVVILAGGLGTRLREETEFRPKPMVEIGNRPILWHIMKLYAQCGYTDFVLCLGYKGDMIRDYFLNYRSRNSDMTVTLGSPSLEVHNQHSELGWRVTLAETGEKTQTAGRLKRIARYLNGDTFLATYGDGVADIDLRALLERHASTGKLATVTAVRPSSRFGELSVLDGHVATFQEKPQVSNSWVNGGFFVMQRAVLDMIHDDQSTLESDLLPSLAGTKQLAVYQHTGFWQCMDTAREMDLLNKRWMRHAAPWCSWDSSRRTGTEPDARVAGSSNGFTDFSRLQDRSIRG
jgi:glucose-1-phosphate cytidylyltransferase